MKLKRAKNQLRRDWTQAGRRSHNGPFRKGSHFALSSPLPFSQIGRLQGDVRDVSDDRDVDDGRRDRDDRLSQKCEAEKDRIIVFQSRPVERLRSEGGRTLNGSNRRTHRPILVGNDGNKAYRTLRAY